MAEEYSALNMKMPIEPPRTTAGGPERAAGVG
jgi:hypothetical protein